VRAFPYLSGVSRNAKNAKIIGKKWETEEFYSFRPVLQCVYNTGIILRKTFFPILFIRGKRSEVLRGSKVNELYEAGSF
jgi:hypothetical protein